MILAFDPGAEYVGGALFTPDGTVLTGEFTPDQAIIWVEMQAEKTKYLRPPQIVYEQFQMYGGGPGKAKTFSNLPEVRWIGRLEQQAADLELEIKSYGASIYKSATEQWKPPPETKGRHAKDAWRLGLWYAVFQCGWGWTIQYKDGTFKEIPSKQKESPGA